MRRYRAPGENARLKTLFRISNDLNTTANLVALYAAIHATLGEVLDARNFIIALCDAKQDRIGVDSSQGRGSVFRFTLELEKQPAGNSADTLPVEAIAGKRVMVVDDNSTNPIDPYILAEKIGRWIEKPDPGCNP